MIDEVNPAQRVGECPLCGPPIQLDEHRTLRVRHATADDVDALGRLYERLPLDDVQRRFFSGGGPTKRFLHAWTTAEQHGGLTLVAELEDAHDLVLIGEAGYAPVADGDHELGITVDAAHRGWLGAWLLDLLFTHASARGLRHLQALVLADNRAMLALTGHRPHVVLDHPEFGSVRLSISTGDGVPSWPPKAHGPRILVESNRTYFGSEQQLREAGFEVAICPGPRRPGVGCPLAENKTCPLLDGADAVIIDLPFEDPRAKQLFDAVAVLHPGLRLIESSEIGEEGTLRRRSAAELLDELRRL